jgi:hypothetical protein
MKLILNLCAICFICSTRGIIIDLVFVVVLSNAKGLAILENDVNSGTSFGHLDDHEKVPPDVGAHTHFVPACLSRTQGAPLSYACRNCSTALSLVRTLTTKLTCSQLFPNHRHRLSCLPLQSLSPCFTKI